MGSYPGGSDPNAEAVVILTTMRKFYRAVSPEEWGAIVNAERTLLLRPDTLYSLKGGAEDARKEGKISLAVQMEVLYNFLENVRNHGVQAAVETEKSRREQILGAMIEFMSAPVPSAGGVLRQQQRVLLTEDAVRVTKMRVSAILDADHTDDPLWEFRRKVLELRVRFLEDALSHGIDLAEERFMEAIVSLANIDE